MTKEDFEINYELIPYEGIVESNDSDFDKIIFDLDEEIDLLSSQADKLDYLIAIASGLTCALLDILWVGEFDLNQGREIASDKVDSFVKKIAEIVEGKTPRRFHRLTHDRNKIWYYTYLREQY